MASESDTPVRKLSPEFWAIVAIGIALLGQAAWLDGKMERLDAKFERLDANIERGDAGLDAKIEALQAGQTVIRERLATLEGHIRAATRSFPAANESEPPA